MQPSPSRHGLLALLILTLARFTVANVEKTIFLGPEPANIPLAKPSLADLHLHSLTSDDSSVRTNLTRIFPSEPHNTALGYSSWLILDELTEGQRYELRVCWAAIEPTSFILDVYNLDTVWETPELIQSLAEYATSRQLEPRSPDAQTPEVHSSSQDDAGERKASVLLLRVRAAADYFTDDKALMANPPPVLVDLILDQYLFNAIPRTLLPTIVYLLVVAAIAWFIARRIASALRSIAGTDDDQSKKQD